MNATTTERISWFCRHCGHTIIDGTGYLTVDKDEAWVVQEAAAAWERDKPELQTVTDILEYPTAAEWHVTHRDCDPNPEATNHYTVDIDRARTHSDLLAWSTHLMRKTWINYTDWPELIEDMTGNPWTSDPVHTR